MWEVDYSNWKQDLFCHDSIDTYLSNFHTDGIHSLKLSEFPLDALTQGNKHLSQSEFIMIGFSGAVARANTVPPVFSFLGVAEKVGLPLIAFSDPSLSMGSNLRLSWYAGNEYYPDLPNVIAAICDQIIEKSGKKLLLAGGSGGGFAALNVQGRMKLKNSSTVFVWNPQTDLIAYSELVSLKYIRTAFPSSADVLDKDNLREVAARHIQYQLAHDRGAKRVIMMDGYDYRHIRDLKKYFGEISESSVMNNRVKIDNTLVCFGDWGAQGNAHTAPPRNLVTGIIQSLANGTKTENIDDLVNKTNVTDRQLFIANSSIDNSKINLHINLVGNLMELETNLSDHYFGFDASFEIIDKESLTTVYEGETLSYTLRCREFISIKSLGSLDMKNFARKYKVNIKLTDFLGRSIVLERDLNFYNVNRYNTVIYSSQNP